MQLRCLSERQFLWLPAHTKYSFWLELHRQEMKMARKCRAHYILVCSIISCLGNCNAPTSVIIFIKSSKFLKSIHFLFICYISLSSFQTVFRFLLQVKPMNQTIFLWITGVKCPWDVKCRKSQTKKSFLIELWFCPKFILFYRHSAFMYMIFMSMKKMKLKNIPFLFWRSVIVNVSLSNFKNIPLATNIMKTCQKLPVVFNWNWQRSFFYS